jgi:hypothetical protein
MTPLKTIHRHSSIILLLVATVLLMSSSCGRNSETDYARFVDPFIGTDAMAIPSRVPWCPSGWFSSVQITVAMAGTGARDTTIPILLLSGLLTST